LPRISTKADKQTEEDHQPGPTINRGLPPEFGLPEALADKCFFSLTFS
jgi:hypothetical protein